MRHRIPILLTLGAGCLLAACTTLLPAQVCGTGAPLVVLRDTRMQQLRIGDGDPATPLTAADLARYDSLTDGADTESLPDRHAVRTVDVPGIGRKGTGLRPDPHQEALVAADPGLIREHLPVLHAGVAFQTAATGLLRWGVRAAESAAADLRLQMPPVRDQGARNTCYAFSLAAALDHAAARIPGARIKAASPQFIYWRYEAEVVSQMAPQELWQEEGMDPLVAWVLLQPQGVARGVRRPAIPGDRGVVGEADAPYQGDPHVLSPGTSVADAAGEVLGPLSTRVAAGECLSSQGATTVPLKNDTATVRMALAEGLPVIVGYPVYAPDWQQTAGADIIPDLRPEVAGQTGGHAVVLVGYQDDASAPGGGYFTLRNSWGTGWGDGGHARVSYAMTRRWGIDPHVVLGVTDTFPGRYALNKPS